MIENKFKNDSGFLFGKHRRVTLKNDEAVTNERLGQVQVPVQWYHLLTKLMIVFCRQQVTSSNLATLNALNRQLKRDYLRGTESTRDRSKSPTKAVRGQHSPTRSRDFARERDRRNNRGDVFSNTGSRRSISPVSMDGMHHDGRISEYNQEYVPWELQERTRVSKQQEYTPIPYSGENYDRNQWKTQQRIEDERMARQAVQFREHSPTAAGVRYNKHDTAPVFYAWNPEDDHIHGGYEAEGW